MPNSLVNFPSCSSNRQEDVQASKQTVKPTSYVAPEQPKLESPASNGGLSTNSPANPAENPVKPGENPRKPIAIPPKSAGNPSKQNENLRKSRGRKASIERSQAEPKAEKVTRVSARMTRAKNCENAALNTNINAFKDSVSINDITTHISSTVLSDNQEKFSESKDNSSNVSATESIGSTINDLVSFH